MAREPHCWDDVIPPDDLKATETFFRREVKGVGGRPALIAVDLYNKVYAGGPGPVTEVGRDHPGACGDYAWDAIAPTQRLFAAARAAGLPVFYTSGHNARKRVKATRRIASGPEPEDGYAIKAEFAPEDGDIRIIKERASAFYGTPLAAHLTQLGVRSVVMCGESTSGCLRASAVDAFSHGYHVVVVEECCFDRSLMSHKMSLFDLHHKYADVMHVDNVVADLGRLAARPAAE